MILRSNYFYGNKVSDYGIENHRVDYMTLAKAFDCVLNNSIINVCADRWEIEHGNLYYYENADGDRLTEGEYGELKDTEGYEQVCEEVYQWYIISSAGANILEECTDEIVFYNEELDIYLWGVTHFGTSWDYVLTDIKIELDEEVEQ